MSVLRGGCQLRNFGTIFFFFFSHSLAPALCVIIAFKNTKQCSSSSSVPDLNNDNPQQGIQGELHFQHFTRSWSYQSRPFFFICRECSNCCILPGRPHFPIKMHIRIWNLQVLWGKFFFLFLENGPLGFVIQR